MLFLQHEIHSEEIVRFVLQHFRSAHSVEPRGMKIVVYTRFDGVELDPHSMAVSFGRTPGHLEENVVLELYNSTGGGTTGVHYDPVFLSVARKGKSPDRKGIAGAMSVTGQDPVEADVNCVAASNIESAAESGGLACKKAAYLVKN